MIFFLTAGLSPEDQIKALVQQLNTFQNEQSDLLNNPIELGPLRGQTITEKIVLINKTIDDLDVNYAKIDFANITEAAIAKMVNELAEITYAFISSAMIINLDVDKLNAGIINTNKINLQSNNGSMVFQDNTIQWTDKVINPETGEEEARVRMQIGEDAKGEFNVAIVGHNGIAMFTEDGITAAAITNPIIKNEMIDPNTRIDGSKLDIYTLLEKINEDNTSVINASKILLDGESNTLNLSFKELKYKTEANEQGINEIIETNNKYFTFGADGLTIGKLGDINKTKFSNDRISFIDTSIKTEAAPEGKEVIYISQAKTHMTDVEIEDSIKIGKFSWGERPNGNLAFTFEGSV